MNLSRIASPLAALALCWLGLAAFVLGTADRMPERVATHFGAGGQPDGWMSRDTHAKTIIGFGIGISAFLLLIFLGIRAFGGLGLNIPHRDYWFAPERREATFDFVARWGIWLACALTAFVACIHWMVLLANERTPVALPGPEFGYLIASFLAAVLAWIVVLCVRFSRKP
ncbi:MAG: DUF1648 domain-containing protein [Chthoniobacteraceae bacterium]